MKNFVFFFIVLIAYVYGDCYMHNPRGSNDRLNEDNVNRNNGNRLWDSQNNAKGGYCVGPAMSYYVGSQLSIEWTTQHGCGNPKTHCNLVMQYMCSSTLTTTGGSIDPSDLAGRNGFVGEAIIRDGTTTNTIPNVLGNQANEAHELTAGGDFVYGMHENVAYYQACQTRQRNQGLFVADRVINGNLQQNGPATRTRQNNNGNRNGLECPEERDYYPYWHPSPWKDIGVFVDNAQNCGFFKSESQNVKEKHVCCTQDATFDDTRSVAPTGCPAGWAPSQYNNRGECESNADRWVTVDAHNFNPSPGIDWCVPAIFNRDNHLGNGITGFSNTFNWTIPNDDSCVDEGDCACVLRMRYNISSADYEGWGNGKGGFADISDSGANSPVIGNPYVYLTGHDGDWNDDDTDGRGSYVRLAVDTTQFGRTFQDRSHVFSIKKRSNDIPDNARVYNLNVRGKRGNIVQTYPAVEYDFVPEYLNIKQGDIIHFQWTGCDTNPAGNAGEGTSQSDRTNLVEIERNEMGANHPLGPGYAMRPNDLGRLEFSSNGNGFLSNKERFRFAMIDQDPTTCLSETELEAANANVDQDVRNCALLNAAGPYFNGGTKTMNKVGTFNYMSTRNNNFTNRSQKAQIQVEPFIDVWAIVLLAFAGTSFLCSFCIFGGLLYTKLTGTYTGSVLESMNEMLFLDKIGK